VGKHRQLLTESATLAAGGGIAGLVIAKLSVRLMNGLLSPNLLPVPEVSIDATVLLFALGVTIVSGLLFGMVPAWQASRTDLNSVMKASSRSGSDSGRVLLRNFLVASELALATMLLIGAGLLLQSLLRLEQVRLGFSPQGLLTFEITPRPSKYATIAKQAAFYRGLVQRLSSLPGVSGAAVTTCVPFGNGLQSRTPASPVGPSLLEPGQSIPIDGEVSAPDISGPCRFRSCGAGFLQMQIQIRLRTR
jgi:putative ABC transport system permease protein